jgi:hypothetical protein
VLSLKKFIKKRPGSGYSVPVRHKFFPETFFPAMSCRTSLKHFQLSRSRKLFNHRCGDFIEKFFRGDILPYGGSVGGLKQY